MGSQYPPSYRTDDELRIILFETAIWTINGRNGEVLRAVPSLHLALETAADFGTAVVAICRSPGDDIIVFTAQAERLKYTCAGREAAPVAATRRGVRARVTLQAPPVLIGHGGPRAD